MLHATSTNLAYFDELTRIDGHLTETRGKRSEPSASDPEVRRILEAAAFIAAQNQRIAYQATFDALKSLVEQRLDFVVRPLPARGLLEAVHSGPRAALPLPQGTLVHIAMRDGRAVRLTTEVSAVIAPIRVRSVDWVESARGPVLLFDVEVEQSLAELGWLSLHVDVLGDLVRSLALHQLLAVRSRGAFVFQRPLTSVEPSPTLDFETAKPLELTFGGRASAEADFDADQFDVDRVLSPLEEMRAHFQLPERSLFVNFRLANNRDGGAKRGPGAGRIRLGILLDRDLPTTPVAANCFRPNIVPVQNLVYLPAQPIKDEGYSTRYPLRQPEELTSNREPCDAFELQAISRVIALDDNGETPLLPSSFGAPERCYRITRSAFGFDNQYYIELALPGDAAKPRQIWAEVAWCQPGLDLAALGQVKPRLFHLATEGIAWKLLPKSAAFIPSPVEGSADKLVELLALSNQKRLTRDEIARVMRLLTQGTEGPWQRVLDALGTMQFEEVLSGGGKAALRRRIFVEVRTVPDEERSVVEDVLQRMASVLSLWGNEVVEVHRNRREHKRSERAATP